MVPMLSTELSDKETFLIGSIVAQWGFLEAEIFDQTLLSFGDGEPLPKEMNNAQFTSVLELWRTRVIETKIGKIRSTLQDQYEKIGRLSDFRQAIVHSRWEWRPDEPDVITALRIHKKSSKSVKFSASDLYDFANQLGNIRFLIRYPGGLEERAREIGSSGGFISRIGWELLMGRRTLDGPVDPGK